MPLSLRRGRVSRIVDRFDGLVRCEVDGDTCLAYPRLTGDVEVGDEVLVNVQARALELGSGGFDVVYANLTRGLGLPPDEGAHVMALPYAPGQWVVRHAEEDGSLADSLAGLPIVLCTIHSQVVPVCAALGGLRVAYVQLAGGALPVSLSRAVRTLRERGLVEVAVAVAPCFDGDVRCVSVASALLWTATGSFEVAVCAVGPGIVGTGTRFGHGAASLAEAANVATALHGAPVLAPRVSAIDPRERHRGVSHHTYEVLELCLGSVQVASAAGGESWRDACGDLPLDYMSRAIDDEVEFFATAFAAGRLAAERARKRAG